MSDREILEHLIKDKICSFNKCDENANGLMNNSNKSIHFFCGVHMEELSKQMKSRKSKEQH